MSAITRLTRPDSPERLLQEALEGPRIRYILMVYVTEDDALHAEWSGRPTQLEALGAVEKLRQAVSED